MRHRLNNLITTVCSVLALVLAFVFAAPLSAWMVGIGVPFGLAFVAALTILLGLGLASTALLSRPARRRSRKLKR